MDNNTIIENMLFKSVKYIAMSETKLILKRKTKCAWTRNFVCYRRIPDWSSNDTDNNSFKLAIPVTEYVVV